MPVAYTRATRSIRSSLRSSTARNRTSSIASNTTTTTTNNRRTASPRSRVKRSKSDGKDSSTTADNSNSNNNNNHNRLRSHSSDHSVEHQLQMSTILYARRCVFSLALITITLLLMDIDPFSYYGQHGLQRKSSLLLQQQPPLDAGDDNILIVIMSDREEGIIPTLAGIIDSSSKPVDVVLIGIPGINLRVQQHFGTRIHTFISLTLDDVEDDLIQNARLFPIWKWPEWHSSIDNPDAWKTEHTIHPGPWDNLPTHAHVLNHVRFYLPYLSLFQEKRYFYFVDDDILVNKDLARVHQLTLATLPPDKGLVSPCNLWEFTKECFHFEFRNQQQTILNMPALYNDRHVCKSIQQAGPCVPQSYDAFIKSVLPPGGEYQKGWNFGFSLFALENWRNNGLTKRYENVMKENYRLHVFPETTLPFGLGIAFLAFAGAVECWNDNILRVVDGFGFIEVDRMKATFGEDFLKSINVAHYTGRDKPWLPKSPLHDAFLHPWLDLMKKEQMVLPEQLPVKPTDNLFIVLGGKRTGTAWIMSILDSHPEVCASGETKRGEAGFPYDVLYPDQMAWYPECSVKRGCSFSFIRDKILQITQESGNHYQLPRQCRPEYDSSNDPLKHHLHRLCNFIKALEGNYTADAISRQWANAFALEDPDYLACHCTRSIKAKGIMLMSDWIRYKGYPHALQEPARINLNNTLLDHQKVIRVYRKNLWARYKSGLMAQHSGFWHLKTMEEKQAQLDAIQNPINVSVGDMVWNMQDLAYSDQAGDEWVKDHAANTLWVDYDECKTDTAKCFRDIYKFINVDTFVIQENSGKYNSHLASYKEDTTLSYVLNPDAVMEKLKEHDWDKFIQQ